MSNYNLNLSGMLQWAVDMAARSDVGYSQTYRKYQTVSGITYFDCSSFVYFAMWLGGGLDVGALGFDTNLANYQNGSAYCPALSRDIQIFQTIGCVQVNTDPQYWQPGDFLVKTRTHIEMCYSLSPLQQVGARNDSLPLADQVAVHSAYAGYYDQVWRFPGDVPPTPPDPGHRPHGPLPLWLLKKAIENHKGGATM